MDNFSYAHSDLQKQKIDKFIADPNSKSGLVTLPTVIETGETVNIPAGRQILVSNLTVDGELTIDGELGVIGGGSLSQTKMITNNIESIDTLTNIAVTDIATKSTTYNITEADALLDAKFDIAGGPITGYIQSLKEKQEAMAANDIDLTLANLFTKTITADTIFTVSNAVATGTVNEFTLRLVNAGSWVITWFVGVKWSGGTPPTLTAAGVDYLNFVSFDGGTTFECTGVYLDVS